MDPKNIERAAIYTLIIILTAALIAGTVALFVHFSRGGETEDTNAPRQTNRVTPETASDPSTTAEEPPATNPEETTGTEAVTDTPTTEETDPEPEVNVTAYDTPRLMYALYNANARESYTTASIIIGMFYKGDEITVTGEVNNGWYQVKYGIYTAYIRGDLLTANKDEAAITIKTYSASKIMYAASNVNVRSSYSTNSDILTTLSTGDEVTVIGETDNGWYQISYNEGTAYIKADLLSASKPVSAPAETAEQQT